MKIFTKSL